MSSRKYLFYVLVIVFLSALAVDSHAAQMPAVFVKVEKATAGDVFMETDYIGRVQPLQEVEIKPELSAKISKVHFTERSNGAN